MRERFYSPIVQTVRSQWSYMDNAQFLAVFQGLTLCHYSILEDDVLNEVLNQFVERLPSQNFEQVI